MPRSFVRRWYVPAPIQFSIHQGDPANLFPAKPAPRDALCFASTRYATFPTDPCNRPFALIADRSHVPGERFLATLPRGGAGYLAPEVAPLASSSRSRDA